MDELQKQLDEIRETVRDLMYVTLVTALLGYQNGLYDIKKPKAAKDVFDVLGELQRKYQKKAAQEEEGRLFFKGLDDIVGS